MSESSTEQDPTQPAPAVDVDVDAGLFDAPQDAAEDISKGYAVYDRVLGRYVGAVTTSKPSAKDAKSLTGGHQYATVRV